MRRYYLSFSTMEALRKIGRALPLAILLVGICALLVTSCGTAGKIQSNTETEYRDSVRIVEHTKDSLIYVPIPLEKNQAIVTLGDTSKLETSVAKSTAYLNERGQICHTLENKSDRTLPAIVPVHSKEIFHGVTSSKKEALTRIVYKEKELTWWQRFRLKAFWWQLLLNVALLLFIFRKPLLKLFVK